MRKFIVNILTGLLFVSMAALVSGCDFENDHHTEPAKIVELSNNSLVRVSEGGTPAEVCYKGITYVFFPNGNASWGSVMMDTDGTPVECE